MVTDIMATQLNQMANQIMKWLPVLIFKGGGGGGGGGGLREETHSNSGYTTNPTNHQKCY